MKYIPKFFLYAFVFIFIYSCITQLELGPLLGAALCYGVYKAIFSKIEVSFFDESP